MTDQLTDKAAQAGRTAQEQAGRATQAGTSAAGRTGQRLGDGLGSLVGELPTERLRQEAQNLLEAFGERTLTTLAGKLENATGRLTEFAENGGKGGTLKAALSGGRALLEGKSPMKALMSAGMSKVGGSLGSLKDKAVETLTGGKGPGGGDKGRKIKVTNIVEDIDVGVPVSVAYNQWTQFEDFPTFMKKVENVSTASETELDWKAQVFWSHRRWHSTVVDQIPDERIVWKSKADKGHVDGAVTFHELTPDLTRILLVLQYHPQGFFERTGNIWRAQGRRARLELKHFRRHVMTQTVLDPDAVHGWRGEVRDGEVIRSDEEVRQEEGRPAEEEEEERGGPSRERPADEDVYPEDTYSEDAYSEDDEEDEGGFDEPDEDEGSADYAYDEDEDEEDDDDDQDDGYGDSGAGVGPGGRSRPARQPAGPGSEGG